MSDFIERACLAAVGIAATVLVVAFLVRTTLEVLGWW